MDPINYYSQLQAPNMLGSFAQGLHVGAVADDLNQQRLAQQLAQKQAQQRAQQYAADLQNAFAVRTPTAFAELIAKYPEQQKAFESAKSMISAEELDNEMRLGAQAVNAIDSGQPEFAAQIIEEQIAARKNSGLDTSSLEGMRKTLETDPDGLKGNLMFLMHALDPDKAQKMFAGRSEARTVGAKVRQEVAKAIEQEGKAKEQQIVAQNAQARERAQIAQIQAQTGVSRAQAGQIAQQTKNLGIEGQKAVIELAAMKNAAQGGQPGIIDPEKRFDFEKKLRDEYQKRTAQFREAGSTFRQLATSASAGTPAGDVALVFNFMKMLDPGSVVRESEFAQARDTAGLYQSLQNSYEKLKSGGFLSEKQKSEFTGLAQQYYLASQKQQKRAQSELGMVVSNYKLNPQNVFGIDSVKDAGAARGQPSAIPNTPPPGAVRLVRE